MEPDYVIRTAMKIDFLDDTVAKIWGLDNKKHLITELKFTGPRYVEDKKVIKINFQFSVIIFTKCFLQIK